MNATELIDKQIADTPGWRGAVAARLRELIHEADPTWGGECNPVLNQAQESPCSQARSMGSRAG
jgi:hypothetical protein